jgi:acetolactate synthase-1/2/3 large subunit
MKRLIIVGRGALSAWKEVRDYAERTLTPVVCSMGGLGIMPTDHVLFRGMIGHTGDRAANLAVAEAEEIIALGTRLDMRQTGTAPDLWAGKWVVMVNTDLSELRAARVAVEAHCETVAEWLHAHLHDV